MARPNSLITGLITGAVVGTVVGLLFAPKTGKESRELVATRAGRYPARGWRLRWQSAREDEEGKGH